MAPDPAVSGSGALARIILTGLAPGVFNLAVGGDVLSDVDGIALAHRLGGPLQIGVALVGAALPDVDEAAQPDPRVDVEDRFVTVAEDGDDLHVVLFGQGVRQVVRRADRSPDPVRVVYEERNVHASPEPPVFTDQPSM